MPVTSHLISGKVRDRLGNILSGATVTLIHPSITPSISETTNAAGEYIINLAELSSQWSVGDSFSIKANKTGEGEKTINSTISSGANQTINFTLEETSILVFGENSQDRYNLNFALLTTYDGEKVTSINPLPVNSSEIDLLYNPATTWVITRNDFQPDSETITLASGEIYKRTFAYNDNDAMISRSRWVKQ